MAQNDDWKVWVDQAQVDINGALVGFIHGAADHLRDAIKNLERAIEALEDHE